MKSILKVFILLCLAGHYQTAEAQLLKRIKKNIERKVEQKIDKTINKGIDSIDKKKEHNEDNNQEVEVSEASFGSTLITHSKKFGAVEIDKISVVKAIKTNDGYQFTGNWWSHEADIFDGFNLVIRTDQNLKHEGDNALKNERQVFKIPEEATLTLGYDPQLVHDKKIDDDNRPAVSDDYQNYDFLEGEVSIDVLTDAAIQISFSGLGSLREIIRHSGDSEDYSETFFESTISGAVDGVSPQFIDNTAVQKTKNSKRNSNVAMQTTSSNNTSTPSIYEFTFETVVEVTTSEQNRSYVMSYLLNPNANYMAIKTNMSDYSDEKIDGESIIVIDNNDSHIFVESSGMKMQISSQMMSGQQMSNPGDQMEQYDYSKINKTGNTKTILGATCYEYTMENSEVKMVLWVAPSINLPNWFVQNKEVFEGHIMEYTVHSNEGTMKSETTAINDNIQKVINPKDYKKMF